MGTTASWVGATLGGSTRPESSPWAMIVAPTMRVEKPHEVPQGCLRTLSRSRNSMPAELAKFWPSMWLVPAWSAFRSRIIASMEWLYTAPGNFSPSLLRPLMTGMANQSSATAR